MSRVGVVGGGPAGMMAALIAAEKGHQVDLYDRNEKLGKKLYITGKGRCNLTNACELEDFFRMIIRNPRFMYSALYGFTNQDLIYFMEEAGIPLKTERGDRVFPVSDKSSDIIKGFTGALKKNQVNIILNQKITDLFIEDGVVHGVQLEKGKLERYDAIILATGGKSYPSTGSDGYFFEILRNAGHEIKPLRPALVPMNSKKEWPKSLQGLALKNVQLTLYEKKDKKNKKVHQELGEMLFTHFGISGPLVLTMSSRMVKEPKNYQLVLDLKPGLTEEKLEQRIQRDFEKYRNKDFTNGLKELLPSKLIPVMVFLSGIDPHQKINQITKTQRKELVKLFKALPIEIESLRSFKEAVVTAGGVSVKEVNPATMESKIIKGLYLAGEMLDVDALTGGFNIQLAVSTGWLAGDSI